MEQLFGAGGPFEAYIAAFREGDPEADWLGRRLIRRAQWVAPEVGRIVTRFVRTIEALAQDRYGRDEQDRVCDDFIAAWNNFSRVYLLPHGFYVSMFVYLSPGLDVEIAFYRIEQWERRYIRSIPVDVIYGRRIAGDTPLEAEHVHLDETLTLVDLDSVDALASRIYNVANGGTYFSNHFDVPAGFAGTIVSWIRRTYSGVEQDRIRADTEQLLLVHGLLHVFYDLGFTRYRGNNVLGIPLSSGILRFDTVEQEAVTYLSEFAFASQLGLSAVRAFENLLLFDPSGYTDSDMYYAVRYAVNRPSERLTDLWVDQWDHEKLGACRKIPRQAPAGAPPFIKQSFRMIYLKIFSLAGLHLGACRRFSDTLLAPTFEELVGDLTETQYQARQALVQDFGADLREIQEVLDHAERLDTPKRKTPGSGFPWAWWSLGFVGFVANHGFLSKLTSMVTQAVVSAWRFSLPYTIPWRESWARGRLLSVLLRAA